MQLLFDQLGPTCSHETFFLLGYLRTSQNYQWARSQPGYFTDVAWVNHLDAVFAKYYFQAYDAWTSANHAAVPRAWQIAFDAADSKKATGLGDGFLGLSAHINRDLPFVLAASGLVAADGTSHKADYDKCDDFLYRGAEPSEKELAARFDPTADDLDNGVLNPITFQPIQAWRETAWRNAELLVSAPTPAARALVAQTIEDQAAAVQTLLLLSQSNHPPLTTSASRDAFCAVHNGDAPPADYPYPFGVPTAY
jgi:hypothetical protein